MIDQHLGCLCVVILGQREVAGHSVDGVVKAQQEASHLDGFSDDEPVDGTREPWLAHWVRIVDGNQVLCSAGCLRAGMCATQMARAFITGL